MTERESEVHTEAAMPFPRVSGDPVVMGGRPCIGGLRVTVGMVISDGIDVDDLLAAFPCLGREYVLEAMRYGARLAQEREILLAPAA